MQIERYELLLTSRLMLQATVPPKNKYKHAFLSAILVDYLLLVAKSLFTVKHQVNLRPVQ
jgi:hypothetical protein